jgi:hypothetical protein
VLIHSPREKVVAAVEAEADFIEEEALEVEDGFGLDREGLPLLEGGLDDMGSCLRSAVSFETRR